MLVSVIHESVHLFCFTAPFNTEASWLGNQHKYIEITRSCAALQTRLSASWRLYSSNFPLMFQL